MVDERESLKIIHEDSEGGLTEVRPDGLVIIFDKKLQMFGLASGGRQITGEMPNEKVIALLTHLTLDQQLQIMSFLGRNYESVGTSSETTR